MIQYWSEDLNQTIQINITNTQIINPLEYKVYDLKADTTYYFNIGMMKLFDRSSFVNFINVSTMDENPIPLLLVIPWYSFGVDILDVDLQIGIELDTQIMYRDIVYSALEHKIYGISSQSELITLDFNPTAIQTNRTIAKLNDTAHQLCFDWIHRKLYWVQKCTTGICIIKLDLTLLEQIGIVKYDEINISKEQDRAMFLHVLPSSGYMYWSLFGSSEVMRSDLDGKT
ncbi:uncharacterized protein LOC114930731 [Nylanderia fulva]|uniref:uncharacterized protein LOC114930731 n=1 Tax=Nylanderia fulva TaxID=613905 RepID=UPI0010FBAFC3|nr:uncharacterized protein LOC114930731 [Nylanderia fulva]